jgi:hypothetical protein
MKRSSQLLVGIVAVLIAALLLAPAAKTDAARAHTQVRLYPIGNSGVSGIVNLREHRGGGTDINVVAFGLEPGEEYLSLYYANDTCALEPYSANDVIGGFYTAFEGGVGVTRGLADDDLDEINSVSVRKADFTLIACAYVHPG